MTAPTMITDGPQKDDHPPAAKRQPTQRGERGSLTPYLASDVLLTASTTR